MCRVDRAHFLIVAFLLCLLVDVMAQTKAESPPTIAFSMDRDRVIIPTSVNGSPPLRLILDTGMTFDGPKMCALIASTGAMYLAISDLPPEEAREEAETARGKRARFPHET